ncbi:MarR family transcriptional regulator [Luedemannella flava]|uniref:MarR family transcriptional regulator n=2 Tax=Luedemannella flava TaxID=349316 RepID=A0ABN2M3S3_9ACTN
MDSAGTREPNAADPIGTIETEIAVLMRRAEATRRSGSAPHRTLDRAAYLILRRLDGAGAQSVTSVAESLGLDGSTVTRQVTAMERDGLVRRQRDPGDGRVTIVEPTPVGLRRMHGVRAAREELYRQLLAGWPHDERAELARLLTKLNETLDDYVRTR